MNAFLNNGAARFLPALVFLVLAGLVVGVSGLLRAHERAWATTTLEVAAAQTAHYIMDYLQTREALVAELAAVTDLDERKPGPEFAAAVARINAQFPGIQAINHINADGIIDVVAPAEENLPALGLDVKRHPVAGPLLARAAATGNWAVSPPLALAQGGSGFVAVLPLKGAAGAKGYVQLVFRLEKLRERIWQLSESAGVALALHDEGKPVVQVGDLDPGSVRAIHTVPVGDDAWTLVMGPEPSSARRLVRMLPILFGLAGAAIMAYLTRQAISRSLALRASEERYRSLVEGSIQGMIILRGDRLLFANRTAAAMLGFDEPEEMLRSPSLALMQPLWNAAASGFAAGEVRDFEVETTRRGGEPIWLVVRASRVEWENAPATQMTLFDGTAYKRAEGLLLKAKERAEHASRAKSNFLAHMSHELRTPLNAVIGFSEVLQHELLGPLGQPRYREYAADIAESGRHLLNIINDILDVAKLEAGRLTLDESEIALPEVAQSCLRMLHERAAAAEIRLQAALAPELPPVRADSGKVKQIVLNLLSNALKFTPAGGEVTVSAGLEQDGGVVVRVRDTGIGMAPEEIPRALEPFTQVAAPPNAQQQGTGLGLPLAKALAQLHGGSLEVESAPGEGTCVSLRLPADRVLWQRAA